MKVKKYMCALLAAILFTSCFGTTVDAAVCATGRFTVTVQAGKEERAKTSFPLDVGEIFCIYTRKCKRERNSKAHSVSGKLVYERAV